MQQSTSKLAWGSRTGPVGQCYEKEMIGWLLEVVFLLLSFWGAPFDALAGWDAASACASQRQEGFREDRVATIVGL